MIMIVIKTMIMKLILIKPMILTMIMFLMMSTV